LIALANVFERKIAYIFRERGYYTIVSAGSRGVADVVAVKANETLFIQCKNNRLPSLFERQKLKNVASSLGGKAVIVTHKKRRILIQEI